MLAIASRAAAYTTPAVMMALRRALASLSMVCDLSGRVIMAATSVRERLTPADMGGIADRRPSSRAKGETREAERVCDAGLRRGASA